MRSLNKYVIVVFSLRKLKRLITTIPVQATSVAWIF